MYEKSKDASCGDNLPNIVAKLVRLNRVEGMRDLKKDTNKEKTTQKQSQQLTHIFFGLLLPTAGTLDNADNIAVGDVSSNNTTKIKALMQNRRDRR